MLSFLLDFLAVSPRLCTSGQPAPADFARIRAAGVEVVINLAAPGSTAYNADEASLALENDLVYAHLPIVWTRPCVAEYASFAALLSAQRERTTLVHCAKNMRVSALVYLRQTLVEAEDESVARARMLQIWQPNPTWSRFIAEVRAEF